MRCHLAQNLTLRAFLTTNQHHFGLAYMNHLLVN